MEAPSQLITTHDTDKASAMKTTESKREQIKSVMITGTPEELRRFFETGALGKGKRVWQHRRVNKLGQASPLPVGAIEHLADPFPHRGPVQSASAPCTECGQNVHLLYNDHHRQLIRIVKTIGGERLVRTLQTKDDLVKHGRDASGVGGCNKYDRLKFQAEKS